MSKKLFIRSSFAIGVCLVFAVLGVVAAQAGFENWYFSLQRPWFEVPQGIFSPVWIIMYILMGISAGIVWSKGFYHKWVKTALYHFGFQLFLNGFWFLLFFAFQKPFSLDRYHRAFYPHPDNHSMVQDRQCYCGIPARSLRGLGAVRHGAQF